MQFDINLVVIVIIVLSISTGVVILSYFFLLKNRSIENESKLKYFQELEAEKKKISSEIHDSISEYTLPLKQYFKGASNFQKISNDEWVKLIEKYEQYLSNLNENIYPADLLIGSLYYALRNLAKLFSSDELNISIETLTNKEVDNKYAIHIFRIIQESLSNAIKNRDLSTIFIVISNEDSYLKIRIIYSGEQRLSYSQWKKRMRGQAIIIERLKTVKGERRLLNQDDWIVEEYKFNIL